MAVADGAQEYFNELEALRGAFDVVAAGHGRVAGLARRTRGLRSLSSSAISSAHRSSESSVTWRRPPRAMRATRMFELSPLVTATNAEHNRVIAAAGALLFDLNPPRAPAGLLAWGWQEHGWPRVYTDVSPLFLERAKEFRLNGI